MNRTDAKTARENAPGAPPGAAMAARRPPRWKFSAVFGGIGVLVGALNLILLADRGQLLTSPFRWDFQNGPGLGTCVLVSGLFELAKAYRSRGLARSMAPPATPPGRP